MLRDRDRRPDAGLSEASADVRALVEEVADIDWSEASWRSFARGLELAERRRGPPDGRRAAEAFVTALAANSAEGADTFMAARSEAPSLDPVAIGRRAARRAHGVARALRALEGHGDDALLMALRLDRGWLRPDPLPLHGPVRIAFVTAQTAHVAEVDPHASVEPLAAELTRIARGERTGLREVYAERDTPTPAAAAIALGPVSLRWARSFHRLAWTRGGGPWMGVADCPPYAVVSTCHAAVDGFVHARLTSRVLGAEPERSVESGRMPPFAPDSSRGVPPRVGFAVHRLEGPPPRFARAMHAFGTVLDEALGDGAGTRTMPFHVPVAPGLASEKARWRRRPLYGLMALRREGGTVETGEALAERLPVWLRREAGGDGLLARVLLATLELPLPWSLRRRILARKPWADRLFPPAEVLTGGGYVSWMRFGVDEMPETPAYPSAVPSFAGDRGGAGLSVAPFEGGLAVGLTTGGALATSVAADDFLATWLERIAR